MKLFKHTARDTQRLRKQQHFVNITTAALKHTDTPTVNREQKHLIFTILIYIIKQFQRETRGVHRARVLLFPSRSQLTKKHSQTHKTLKELKTPKSCVTPFQLPLIKHTDTQRVERTQETQDKQERALCHRHNHNLQNTSRDTLLAWHKNNVSLQ